MYLRSSLSEPPSDSPRTYGKDWQRLKLDLGKSDLSESSDSTECELMSASSSSGSLNSFGSERYVVKRNCFRQKSVSWVEIWILQAVEVKSPVAQLSQQPILYLDYFRKMKTQTNMSISEIKRLVVLRRHHQMQNQLNYTQTAMQLSGCDLANTRSSSLSRELLRVLYPGGLKGAFYEMVLEVWKSVTWSLSTYSTVQH